MSDDSHPRPSFLERLTSWLSREPDNREELLDLLHAAYDKNLLDADALSMIEGVMQVSEMQVREIMIPRAQMDVVDINEPAEKLLPFVIETAHSRFPAVDGDRDDVVGILLAKDLLRLCTDEEVDLRDMLRPAVFIPESKRLNVLLREFRASRNHIAIVVDEYGGTEGLVTLEDALREVVGAIDEKSGHEETHVPVRISDTEFEVDGGFPLWDLEPLTGLQLETPEHTTVAGFLMERIERLPETGDEVDYEGVHFRVAEMDGRWVKRVHITTRAGVVAAEAPRESEEATA